MKVNKFFQLLRVKQWTKNFICFSGIIFGEHLANTEFWLLSIETFFCFCFISSSIYVLNDIIDKEADSRHPVKRNRPIANGDISIISAIFIGISALSIGLLCSLSLGSPIFYILLLYVTNNIIYTYYLKRIPVADVLSISFGFILRLITGIYVVGDTPTPWIMLCTLFLALFLGFSKRKAELVSIKDQNDIKQRIVLKKYNQTILDNLVNDSSLGAVITYALFTTMSGKNPSLVITIPIVYYAIAYYKLSLFQNKYGEEPDAVLLNDKIIWRCIMLWLITYITIVQFKINIFSF